MKIRPLYKLFGGKCVYCRRLTAITGILGPLSATVDHDIPKCRFGVWTDNNTVLACHQCNGTKGDMTGPEFLSFRQTRKLPASYIEFLEQRLLKRLNLSLTK